MIVWTEDFPLKERLLGYFRLCRARPNISIILQLKRVLNFPIAIIA